jgi:hypothetical protein
VSTTSSSLTATAGGTLDIGSDITPYKVTASFSATSTSERTGSEQREFSLRVYVKARQAAIPSGIAKMLEILEQATLTKDYAPSVRRR